jgi:methionine synthase I (cobalamin-dependent)/5,10-methylenetetrahydrofolate reductase
METPPRPFRDFLEEQLVVFDGGLGTELYRRGVFINKSFDELNLVNPQLVTEVHRSYVDAGADVIETNTFAANRVKLSQHGLVEQVVAINEQGARLARAAAGSAYVAGAIGPLGIRIEPWGPTSLDEARDAFAEQARALVAGGIDLFVLETFSDLPEIRCAIEAVRSVSALPIVAQMTLEEDGCSLEGVKPEDFAAKLDAYGADVIGVNCSVGPHAMLEAVEKMAAATGRKLSAQPNAGIPRNIDGRNIYLCSPEYMATYARRFIQAGARVVGGCCGTTPEHIAAIRRAVKSVAAAERPRVRRTKVEDKPVDVTPVPPAEKSSFARKIVEGKFAILVEVLPPRGCDPAKVVESVRYLREQGIDAVNIPDGPRASARMTPQALAHILQTGVGIETIIHYTCRDRNLLGMQSDLLGAYAIGIRNLILITGDPPKMGDYPDATAVFDVDAVGLTNMVSRLNHGLDMGGNAIGQPTGYFIGVGVNPGATDLEREIRRFEWKVEAGAEYAVTQPVFDIEVLDRFLDRVAGHRIPIIAGIWPLASYRNAEFMNNEVPGVVVPQRVLERMKKADTKTAARAEGVAIAREMLEGVKSRVSGAQISAPFGRYETAIEVIDGIVDRVTGEKRKLA